MPSHRILQLNAISTSACALAMFAARGVLHPLFGLDTPFLLDAIATALLAYAGFLAWAAQRRPVGRQALLAFTLADAAWVAASAVVLILYWGQLTPLARALIIAVAIIVEAFATLQFRAAGKASAGSLQVA
jgi:CHASE2 domain-containing sensor protein